MGLLHKTNTETGEKERTSFGAALSRTFATTSKQLIWVFSINGILWIWCSYVLAFMGKDQIAESLSSNVCTVIIGQLVAFLVTKTIENVFRYNDFGGKSSYPEDVEFSELQASEHDEPTDAGVLIDPIDINETEDYDNGYENDSFSGDGDEGELRGNPFDFGGSAVPPGEGG